MTLTYDDVEADLPLAVLGLAYAGIALAYENALYSTFGMKSTSAAWREETCNLHMKLQDICEYATERRQARGFADEQPLIDLFKGVKHEHPHGVPGYADLETYFAESVRNLILRGTEPEAIISLLPQANIRFLHLLAAVKTYRKAAVGILQYEELPRGLGETLQEWWSRWWEGSLRPEDEPRWAHLLKE
jgi:hypothetical protein